MSTDAERNFASHQINRLQVQMQKICTTCTCPYASLFKLVISSVICARRFIGSICVVDLEIF